MPDQKRAFLRAVRAAYNSNEIVGEGYSRTIKVPKGMLGRLLEDELGGVTADEIGNDISEESGATSVLTDGINIRLDFGCCSMVHTFSRTQSRI